VIGDGKLLNVISVTDARLDDADIDGADFSRSLLRNVSTECTKTAGAIEFVV